MEDTKRHTVQQRDDFSSWRDLLCVVGTRVDVTPLAPDTRLTGSVRDIGAGPIGVHLFDVRADPHLVSRRGPARADDDAPYFVAVQMQGTCLMRQNDREAVLEPGDFALCDSQGAYELVFPQGDHCQVDLIIPRNMLQQSVPRAAHVTAMTVPCAHGIGAAVSPLLAAFPHALATTTDTDGELLCYTTLQLLALALACRIGDKPSLQQQRTRHVLRAHAVIQAHSDDEDLNPAAVAAAVNLSLGYLHRLFQEAGTTVMGTIAQTRLQRCRYDLRDTRYRHDTIAQIASRHGLTDASHFTRAFKKQYGVTPREWRNNTPS